MRKGFWITVPALILALHILAVAAGAAVVQQNVRVSRQHVTPAPPPEAAKPPAPRETRESKAYVPEALRPWNAWVLHDKEQSFCPTQGNDTETRQCVFPGAVELKITDKGAEFALDVAVYARGRVRLPYAASSTMSSWPVDVHIRSEAGKEREDKAALVQEDAGVPYMLLTPGQWRVSGFLPWAEIPDMLMLPPDVGLVKLFKPENSPEASSKDSENSENGGVREWYPDLAAGGKLRLAAKDDMEQEKRPEDSLDVRIFRLVRDDLPMRVTTLLRLDVSGRARRLRLDKVLLPDSMPLAVQSPLPLQFAPDGGVFVQARPGHFDVRITSRMQGPVEAIGPVEAPYEREFWAFEAHDDLRVVEIHGVPGVDPQTTDMPQEWKTFPSYLVEPGNTVTFKEMHRGAAGGSATAMPDRLNINRTLMLDFDGRGLTVRDVIQGTVRNDWTLSMLAPGELGRATLQGKDQPVVLLEQDKKDGTEGKDEKERPGVELRNSAVNLVAESRYDDFQGLLPSTGWDREFDSVHASLQLPPGWRLLTASGVDSVGDSWISRWSLLDIFLCLVIVLAVFKLKGFLPGLAVFAFLALAWQEHCAPRHVWLLLLAALALYKIFAGSKLLASYRTGRRLSLWLYGLALAVMAVVAVPFVYLQVNQGLYPQLEPVPGYYNVQTFAADSSMVGNEIAQMESAAEAPAPRAMSRVQARGKGEYAEQKVKSLMYDPEALVQTGPGVPDWQWRSVGLSWSGPVAEGESMELYLLSPRWNMWLSFARVALLVLALAWLVDVRPFRAGNSPDKSGGSARKGAAALLLVCCVAGALPAMAAQPPASGVEQGLSTSPGSSPGKTEALFPPGDSGGVVFPPGYLLHELEQRLLEPAPCYPNCMSSPRLKLYLDDAVLRLEAEVHAATRLMAPLPVVSDRWMPTRVLVDDEQALDIFRRDQELFVVLDAGVHRVVLEGPPPRGLSFQVSLPLSSKQGEVEAPGWSVQGLDAGGTIQGSLRLARSKGEQKDEEAAAANVAGYRIPPFLEVRREITLGLEWSARTEIRRLSPLGEAVHLEVPLLPGESVLSEDVRVENGKALVQLEPRQPALTWESRMQRAPRLELRAPREVPWVEVWQLAPANIWHLDIAGIPESSVLGPGGEWRPAWRPWPGEEVTVDVTRPKAAPGESMTIEHARLTQRVGKRLDENELNLGIRASKGGRHRILLPEDAELTGLTASGRELPLVKGKPGEVEFPIQPGSQEVSVRWRQARQESGEMRPPVIDLGHPAVNAQVRMEIPRDRWVLLTQGGPLLGPAVKYWTYLLAALVFAVGLGFLPWTPLKRWQWFLLAVGLSQLHPLAALCAVAWLPILGLRREYYPEKGWFVFGVMQLVVLGVVLAGLVALYTAVELGLLGLPNMQVTGNGSYGNVLVWTQDRTAGAMPLPVVYSAPLWLFRVVMLGWSLWLAVSLLSWLRWGWESFSQGGLLRSPKMRITTGAKNAGFRQGAGMSPNSGPNVEPDTGPNTKADAKARGGGDDFVLDVAREDDARQEDTKDKDGEGKS